MSQNLAHIVESFLHLGDMTDACSYLSDKVSCLRYCYGAPDSALYRQLLDQGFRRSGMLLYRPVCAYCKACQVLRVPVGDFQASKEQRRIWRRGEGVFQVRIEAPSFSPEKLQLYQRYLRFQHGEADSPTTEEDYQRFLVESCLGPATLEIQVWAGQTLAGLGILDRLEDALSSVYFYFNPDFASFSLGTWSILWEIQQAQAWGLEYYYLGYYIKECGAMAYKGRFRPCEVRDQESGAWCALSR